MVVGGAWCRWWMVLLVLMLVAVFVGGIGGVRGGVGVLVDWLVVAVVVVVGVFFFVLTLTHVPSPRLYYADFSWTISDIVC